MTLQDHVFVPRMSANPRYKRSCDVCSRVPEFHPEGLSPAKQAQFLADVVELVSLMRGMSNNPAATDRYVRHVNERLEMGARTFGTQFLHQQNIPEALEEGPDTAAYSILELARLMFLGATEDDVSEIRVDLVSGAAHAAISYQYFLAAEEKRQELGL